MHIFCAAPIQSGACGQNGCLHASGHPGRYMRRSPVEAWIAEDDLLTPENVVMDLK